MIFPIETGTDTAPLAETASLLLTSSSPASAIPAIDTLPASASIGVASHAIAGMPHLSAFFGGRPITRAASEGALVAGWGRKPSGDAARRLGQRTNRPWLLLEDGFIRSVGLGKAGAPSVSLVLDDIGIYFDAREESRLEQLLSRFLTPAEREAGRQALALWQEARLSKYNLGNDCPLDTTNDRIILVDQVLGDSSIAGAGADETRFQGMLDAALSRHSAENILIRTHPDVVAGKARGYLTRLTQERGLALLGDDLTPQALLDNAREIWTVSSALGFEAILRGVPVKTFGTPFYAGWGLTEDHASDPIACAARARRRPGLTPEDLAYGTFIAYARYADPVRRKPASFLDAVARLVDWRAKRESNRNITTFCFGFDHWKRKASIAFFDGPGARVRFSGTPKPRALKALSAKGAARIAVWGMREKAGFVQACRSKGWPLHRVEDGFIRSVGLGSDLLPAGSLALDDEHLYYDASGESRLITTLERCDFTPALLDRARALRERMVASALTKYNLGSADMNLRGAAQGRKVVLVAEQVPDDAAIRLGGGLSGGNLALLQAVRASEPGAFLVYKEHPDLVSGNRNGRLPPRDILRQADLILSHGDLRNAYTQIDALHAVNSLAGFEALLRGVQVTTWGRPWYGGWGLTDDRAPEARLRRKLDLDALVAGALIIYPRYIDPVTLIPCEVEDFLDALDTLRDGRLLPRVGFIERAGRFLRPFLPGG